MRLFEQLEHGKLLLYFKRKSGNKDIYKRPRCKVWRKWMKDRRNDEDIPMYNRYKGYEL